MTRHFNTAGPCNAERDYLLSPERLLPEIGTLIERALYFILYGPRKSGKTTSIRALACRLVEEGRYTAVVAHCDGGQEAGRDLERGITAVLDALIQEATGTLPESFWPPAVDTAIPAGVRLRDLLARWALISPRPIVLFLDDVDTLQEEVLFSVVLQIQAGYASRPRAFPQCIALVGLWDVRRIRLSKSLGQLTVSSFFDITARSLAMRSFSLDDVIELYGQYTEETGQPFLPAVVKDAFTLSQGHPGLVNALAAEIVGSLVIDQDRAEVIGPDQVERARIVVQRYPEYLEPLRKALSTSRFRQLCKAVLDEQVIAPDSLEELWLTLYHGWVIAGRSGLKIANPMFRDIIRDVLAWDADKLMSQAGAFMPDTMIAMETARDGILSRPLLP